MLQHLVVCCSCLLYLIKTEFCLVYFSVSVCVIIPFNLTGELLVYFSVSVCVIIPFNLTGK